MRKQLHEMPRRTPERLTALLQEADEFFGSLESDSRGQVLLREQDHCIEFDLSDGEAFRVEIRQGKVDLRAGPNQPQRFDDPDLIHFALASRTLQRLMRGEIRFTDALIPTDPDGADAMLLLECTLFKWGVLSWVGRLSRAAQLLQRT